MIDRTDRERLLLQGLAHAVVEMDEERAVFLAHEALAQGMDPYVAITEGLAKGMDVVSQKYDAEEYFVPEILLCSDAMYAALAVLQPHLNPETAGQPAKIVIGVVEGDTHDIGKNIVKVMLGAAGFEMLDLGRDVPLERFVDEAARVEADMIALSTLMSTTRHGMRRVVELLRERGLRDRVKVMIGGPPVSTAFCQEIGADAYGGSAADAVRIARVLVGGAR
jgi:dimethylamine corrinoid protein